MLVMIIIISPSWGHHLVLLLDGVRNPVAQELDIDDEITARRVSKGVIVNS